MTIERLNNIQLINADCMDVLRELPDNAFDLAIVDPPYSNAGGEVERTGGSWAKKYGKNIKRWDIAPSAEYFEQLMRVSRNQIIWGGNYFQLPPTRCFVIWKKLTISESFTMSMCEYAWTSFDANAKVFECMPQGKPGEQRIHPCQKPVELYTWLLKRYAKAGDKILDTHLGSGSICLAADAMGFELTGIELDPEYYDAAKERLIKQQSEPQLFAAEDFVCSAQESSSYLF